MSELSVAIIMPVSNHWELTQRALRDLLMYTDFPDWHVMVVDDGSTDGTWNTLVQEYFDHPRILGVRSVENRGFSPSINTGIQQALDSLTPDIILLLNNDIEIWEHGWLTAILRPFQVDRKLVVGRDYINYNEATRVDGRIVPYVGGWCMAFPAELVSEIGGMDERFAPAFYEDVLFSATAQAAGYRLVSVESPIKHLYGRTSLDGRFDIPAIHAQNRPLFVKEIRKLRGEVMKPQRVVFYCPGNRAWDDTTLDGIGLGGAESAIVQLTRALSAMGHEVTVYNKTPGGSKALFRGVFEGDEYEVLYRPISLWTYNKPEGTLDAFVDFRCSPPDWQDFWRELKAHRKFFWSCDQCTDLLWREAILPFVHEVIGISAHHVDFLHSFWRPTCPVSFIPLGVTPADYVDVGQKVRNRLIYCSVPLRGLEHLLRIFPRIREAVPDATLVTTADYRLWGTAARGDEALREAFAGMEGVHFLGKIPRRQLIAHQKAAELHVYPCDYIVKIPGTDLTNQGECFGVASIECQAAGAPTITTTCGALRTTVEQGMSGVLLEGTWPDIDGFDDRFTAVVVDLLTTERAGLVKMQEYARSRALSRYSWKRLAWAWGDKLFT